MPIRADSAKLRRSLRRREIEAVFQAVPEDAFEEVLELGAGDGFQAPLLARYAKRVLCTDLNDERLQRVSDSKVAYDICDAEALPYEACRFDLVYSSNLLEHLPDPARALLEMSRVLRDDGVMIHIVPNRLWKILHLALFYPSQALSLAEIALSRRRRESIGMVESRGNNLKGKQPSFVERNLLPAVHGEYAGHYSEFIGMGASYWKPLFAAAGLETAGRIHGLPAHSPYRFGLEAPRRVLSRLGVSSCNGYVLRKAGRLSEVAALIVSRNGHERRVEMLDAPAGLDGSEN